MGYAQSLLDASLFQWPLLWLITGVLLMGGVMMLIRRNLWVGGTLFLSGIVFIGFLSGGTALSAANEAGLRGPQAVSVEHIHYTCTDPSCRKT
jgi:hypothetical protein